MADLPEQQQVGAVDIAPLESTQSTSTRTIPAPGELQALQQATAAGKGAADAQAAVGPAQATTSEFEAQGKAAQADVLEQQQAAMQAAADRRAAAMETARANATAAEDKVAGYKFHDYWKDKSTGSKILAVIGRAMTGYAGGDTAHDAISQAIATDFDRQKAELGSMQQVAAWKRQGVQDVDAHYEHELAAMEKQYAAGLAATARRYEAVAIRAKIPEDQARNNVVVQQLLQQAAQLNAQSNQRFERHATYTHDVKQTPIRQPTVKAGAGLNPAELAPDVATVTGYQPATADFAARAGVPLAGRAQSQQGQDWLAASNRVVEKLALAEGLKRGLTSEQGQKELRDSMIREYLPAASDTPQTVAAKYAALRTRVAALATAQPAGASAAAAASPGAPAAAGAPADVVVGRPATSPGAAGAPSRIKLAHEAIADPHAPPEVKARAREIIRQAHPKSRR